MNRSGKNYESYLHFIESVKRGEKSIVFGPDYVVLSKAGYENLIDYHHPEIKSISYDEMSMHNWFKKRFITPDDE